MTGITDEELALEVCPDNPCLGLVIVAGLSTNKRIIMERMVLVAREHEADAPTRIQLRRSKGWRMPPDTVKVDRSTRWGNPFDWRTAQDEWGGTDDEAKASVVSIFRDWLTMEEAERFAAQLRPRRIEILANLRDLRGKNLACWCAPGSPCHADVLLELANR